MNCIKSVFINCDNLFYSKHESNSQLSLDKNSEGLIVIKKVEYHSNYRFNKVEQIGNLLRAPGFIISNNLDLFTTGRFKYLKIAASIAAFIVLFPFIFISINLGSMFQYVGGRYNSNADKLSTANSTLFELRLLVRMYNDKELLPEEKKLEDKLEKLVLLFNQSIQSMRL